MATLVLAGVGGALGASIGGGILGLSSVAIGKAVGATLGSVIDQRLLGGGSAAVEIGRRDSLRIMGSREGAPVPRLWGQMRLPGQIIWSSRFEEHVQSSGGGKGAPSAPEQREYSYSVSLAIALCEGPVTRIGRIWADGQVIDASRIDWRLHRGDEDQLPDPLIAASLPEGEAPAFRGTAYVVIENLGLGPYGNRIPQFSFEVMRRTDDGPEGADEPVRNIRAVALVPGTGEYALATEPVSFGGFKGEGRVANVNNDQGRPDAEVAIGNLVAEVPACEAVSLVVSWFGSDLRCGQCRVEPKVEQAGQDGVGMPWSVSGISRAEAAVVQQVEGRPGFGGTPADASVVQAIGALREAGQAVMFYPFLLMDIRPGNGLPDPWGGAEQPEAPWRGRITLSAAPGQGGSPDGTAAAGAEVAAFFGSAQPSDFAVVDGAVVYSGPDEASYRRFVLHYAHLCKAAGGVDAFCVGSELRGLTTIRDDAGFPVVDALRQLAAELRAILGPETRISYAADWSEYFGYHPADGSGDVLYHLDPFWADPNVDFVGIDNYMPLSDWRDGDAHADAAWGSIHDLDYLRANIEGGEGYDWYYPDAEARDAQIRAPIEDGAYGDPWVYRYKDIRNWWGRYHWNRLGGLREETATAWEPGLKPVWFTEMGCPAIDKGTNQPNVFLDPLSAESGLPHYSDGGQDVLIQRRYLQAMQSYWGDPANNPVSRVYDGPMIDMSRAFVWAWDARPYPDFPRRLAVWSDGRNHARGHWISGRTQLVELGDAVREICADAGLGAVDVSGLDGVLQGYVVADTETARQSLQPLMLAYGFDAFERDGVLVFRNRRGKAVRTLDPARMVVEGRETAPYELTRQPVSEAPERVRVGFVHPMQDYLDVAAEAQVAGAEAVHAAGSDLPLAMSHAEGSAVAARWLAETRVARDRVSLALPRSDMDLGAGDVVALALDGRPALFRIDRVEETAARRIEAVRVEAGIHDPVPLVPELVTGRGPNRDAAPHVEILDLPLLGGSDAERTLRVAATRTPWSGPLTVYAAAQDHDYAVAGTIERPSVMGTTLTDLEAAAAGRWAAQSVDVRVTGGALLSREAAEVLNGANALALRAPGARDWEVAQFRDAALVGPDTYRLSGLLRGQGGTEALIAPVLPAGADLVLLDGAALRPETALDWIGRERHFRVGPATRALSDPLFAHVVHTPGGAGLRPYAPAHLGAERSFFGTVALAWVRRTRLGGDNWFLREVALGETAERYLVRVLSGGSLLREAEVTSPGFSYTTEMQAADGAAGTLTFAVAQVSDTYGPGLEARITFDV